jgi:CHAT domain-containing protein
MNERFAFSYTPSPGIFVHLAESARKGSPDSRRSIVAVADPLGSSGSEFMAARETESGFLLQAAASTPGPTLVGPALLRSAVSGDREALDRLPRLPHSRVEAVKAASTFRNRSLLLGPDASKTSLEAVLRKESSLGVLHLATHALMDHYEPGRSALVLYNGHGAAGAPGDGLITAEEVLLSWHLDADLVTLSGCQTNHGSSARGGENLGFAQAFIAAGARSLLMSRWKVDDLATALFMGRFYENLTGSYVEPRGAAAGTPMSKARSLQEAQLWLRDVQDGNGNTPFAHPAYWAGFVLIGNPD